MNPFRRDYEADFRAWANANGHSCTNVTYVRKSAQGAVAAIYCKPRTPAKATVVVVHGTGNDKWFPLIGLFKTLLSHEFAVFAFDVDGHGHSSSTRLDRMHLTSCVRDAIGYLEGHDVGAPLYLLGHSLGAVLALSYLASTKKAAGAILVSLPLRLNLTARALLKELGAFMTPHFWRATPEYGIWGLIPAAGPFKRKAFPIRMWRETHALGYLDTVDEYVKDTMAVIDPRSIKPPVLFIYGTEDRICFTPECERFARAVEKAQLYVATGANHFTTILHANVEDKIIKFLQSNTGTRPQRP